MKQFFLPLHDLSLLNEIENLVGAQFECLLRKLLVCLRFSIAILELYV
jgi:hypothetical protein